MTCQLNNAELSERRKYLLGYFATALQQIKPVNKGYAFTFKGNEETLKEMVQLIHLERKCCRFLKFDLEISNEQHPINLKITGPKGTQEFLRQMLELPQ